MANLTENIKNIRDKWNIDQINIQNEATSKLSQLILSSNLTSTVANYSSDGLYQLLLSGIIDKYSSVGDGSVYLVRKNSKIFFIYYF